MKHKGLFIHQSPHIPNQQLGHLALTFAVDVHRIYKKVLAVIKPRAVVQEIDVGALI